MQGWAPHILSAISEILGAGHCPIVDATAASCYMMLGAAAHSKHSLQCTQRHSPHSRRCTLSPGAVAGTLHQLLMDGTVTVTEYSVYLLTHTVI